MANPKIGATADHPFYVSMAAESSSETPVITGGTITDARHVRYEAPIAAELVSIVAALDPIASATLTIAAQPDFPRKLQVRIVDTNNSVTGTVTLVGIGARGQAVGQTIQLTGGTRTVTTDDAYATLTSATTASVAGAAAGDTIGIGVATALGLPGLKTPVPSTFAVYKSNVGNANEAVGTVDATAGTIVPTSVPNASRTYDFWYTQAYVPTATQAAHDHDITAPA
jgi:hypothetical protein